MSLIKDIFNPRRACTARVTVVVLWALVSRQIHLLPRFLKLCANKWPSGERLQLDFKTGDFRKITE